MDKKELVKYLKENVEIEKCYIDVALKEIDRQRCPLDMTSVGDTIMSEIEDAIDDFAYDNCIEDEDEIDAMKEDIEDLFFEIID